MASAVVPSLPVIQSQGDSGFVFFHLRTSETQVSSKENEEIQGWDLHRH